MLYTGLKRISEKGKGRLCNLQKELEKAYALNFLLSYFLPNQDERLCLTFMTSRAFTVLLVLVLSLLLWGYLVSTWAWTSLQTCGIEMLPMTKSCHFFKITFKRTRKHFPPDFIVLTVMKFLHSSHVHLEGGS